MIFPKWKQLICRIFGHKYIRTYGSHVVVCNRCNHQQAMIIISEDFASFTKSLFKNWTNKE